MLYLFLTSDLLHKQPTLYRDDASGEGVIEVVIAGPDDPGDEVAAIRLMEGEEAEVAALLRSIADAITLPS